MCDRGMCVTTVSGEDGMWRGVTGGVDRDGVHL